MPPLQPWSAITSCTEADRRAGGRRKYNATRQFSADMRRIEVQKLILEYRLAHGSRARIARELCIRRPSRRDIHTWVSVRYWRSSISC